MINEQKVILMTKLASYEDTEGRRARKATGLFRGDYVVLEILKSIIAVTIAFAICFGAYMFLGFETFMQDIYKMDFLSFARNVLSYYLVVVAIYVAFTFFYAIIRYYLAKRSLRRYYQYLKLLNAYYHKNPRR